MTELTKPMDVPEEAVLNDAGTEWELGQKNEQGNNIGEWKWWLVPNGHLVCHTIYEGESSKDFTYTRYHQDGTYSQKGTYKNGVQHGTAYYQASENETTEQSIPHQAPENVFRMIYEWDQGQVISSQLFDYDGNELDQYGNITNPTIKGDTPSDAIWNDHTNEWEKGDFRDNLRHGLWVGWDTNGKKCSETSFDSGLVLDDKRFHPDGTLSLHRKYGMDQVTTYKMHCQSNNPSNEYFPEGGVPEGTFKLEYFYNDHGYTTSWKAYDESGNVIEEHELYNNQDNQIPQTKFSSFEEASKIWQEKGEQFYKDINWWLSQYYSDSHNVPEGTPEPIDERADMERIIFEALETFNKEGAPSKVRTLFAPSYEPISKYTWENFGRNVEHIIAIDDNTILAKVGNEIYELSKDSITLLLDVLCIGSSKNKQYIAKAYDDRIEITEGVDGNIISTFQYPKQFNEELYENYEGLNSADVFTSAENMGLVAIKVSSDGKKALLIAAEGIYLLGQKTIQVYPQLEKLEEMVESFSDKVEQAGGALGDYIFDLRLSYPNADFSIDDQYIVASAMIPSPTLAGTCIYKIEDEELELLKYGEQDSMFGIVNQFHDNGKDMLHAACLYASINTNWSESMPNTTFRLGLDQIEDGEEELDNFAGGYRQAPGMVLSACPLEDGFALGVDGGYLWWHGPDSSHKGYLFVGGVVRGLDITPDKQHLVVATSEGQVIRFKFITERGTGMITDMKLQDEKRYLFFKTYEPMVW